MLHVILIDHGIPDQKIVDQVLCASVGWEWADVSPIYHSSDRIRYAGVTPSALWQL